MAKFTDVHEKTIKDGKALLFSLPDNVEPGGVNRFVTNVKLCYWSENEKQYVPLSSNYPKGTVFDSEVVRDCTCKNEDLL